MIKLISELYFFIIKMITTFVNRKILGDIYYDER